MIPERRMHSFDPSEGAARELDAADGLGGYRARFSLPRAPDGSDGVYLCGNSLGLMPNAASNLVHEELEDWAMMAVEGHFRGRRPWYSYHELLRDGMAHVVGAKPTEVVAMNSLTVNLHLMLVSFYRPTSSRYAILTDGPLFPSDRFALRSQIAFHGFDPDDGLITLTPAGHDALDEGQLEEALEREGDRIALVLLSGVNYHTGQLFDVPRVAAAARAQEIPIGLDLAHAAGNVPLALHDWGIDFAVWCTYKYLNSGPGAVAGCFVHERHGQTTRPRFAGWWGVDPNTRFDMQAAPAFEPQAGADGWQLSNPPILAMAPVKASLDVFEEVGMSALRAKSEVLTAYLAFLLEARAGDRCRVVTPPDPARRGCQLSIAVGEGGAEFVERLVARGIVVDYRPPGIMRAAPVPLYNGFHDVWRFVDALAGGPT